MTIHIQQSLGADLQPQVDVGIKEGPPVDETDLAGRTSRWKEALTSPEFLAAIGQFGVNIAQPRSILQSKSGKFANAVAGAGQAAGRVDTNRFEREQEVIATQQAQQGVEATTSQAETSRRRLEEVEIPQVEPDIESTKAGTGLTEAQTEGVEASTERDIGLLELDKEFREAQINAANATTTDTQKQTGLREKETQARYINALANKSNAAVNARGAEARNALNAASAEAATALKTLREEQAESLKAGGTLTGTAQSTQLLANAIKKQAAAHGVVMTDAEATLIAAGFQKTSTTIGKESFIAEFMLERSEASIRSPTEAQMAAWFKIAESAADALGLQSINVSVTAPAAQQTGSILATRDNLSQLMQGASTGTETVTGVNSLGEPATGLQIIQPNGTALLFNGQPVVVE